MAGQDGIKRIGKLRDQSMVSALSLVVIFAASSFFERTGVPVQCFGIRFVCCRDRIERFRQNAGGFFEILFFKLLIGQFKGQFAFHVTCFEVHEDLIILVGLSCVFTGQRQFI
ncbi:MAG: hypothetical protein ACD_62C00490G0001 [uncultured bacterium]|nr:MAG: hypothetical protein ACD_62C00490G0001 [uncultured bacterium]